MDKLISANAVIAILENARFRAGKDLSKAYLIADLQEQIERLPSAFDKEKVKVKLENEIELVVKDYPLHGRYIKKNRAIEIVERGGG